MSKRKEEVTWVMVGPAPYLGTCQRCGGTVPMPAFGISIKEFARLCNEGVEAHRGCEEAGNGEAEAGEPAASPVGVVAAAHGAVGGAE